MKGEDKEEKYNFFSVRQIRILNTKLYGNWIFPAVIWFITEAKNSKCNLNWSPAVFYPQAGVADRRSPALAEKKWKYFDSPFTH